jgi:hypothetical protein
MINMRKVYNFIPENRTLIGIFALGVVLRSIFLLRANETLPVSTDEVWPGLMALGILRGDLPLVYTGNLFLGPFSAYLNTPIIYLLGASTLSARLYPFLLSILFLVVTYHLAKALYGETVATTSTLFATVPPVYLILTGTIAPDNYISLITFGSLALLIAVRAPLDERTGRADRYLICLGLLSGLALWYHLLFIVYLIPVWLYILLRDWKVFSRKGFYLGILFFLIGFSPFLIHNIIQEGGSIEATRGIGIGESIKKLIALFQNPIPALLGLKILIYFDHPDFLSLPGGIMKVLLPLYTFLILSGILFGWKPNKKGTALLLFLLIFTALAFSRSARSHSWTVRYIIPIMSVLPILIGLSINGLAKRSKAVAILSAILIIAVNLYGLSKVYMVWGDKVTVEEKLDLPDNRGLITFLESEGIEGAYATLWTSHRLTYETGEKVLSAQPYDERFGGKVTPAYKDKVDAMENIAFIFHRKFSPLSSPLFEENLKALGGSYKKKEIGPYTILYSFSPPQEGREIPTSSLSAKASKSNEKVFMAFDGDLSTRWATHSPQRPAEFFEIDLGRPLSIVGVKIMTGGFKTDFPRGYRIEVSTNREDWMKVIEIPNNIGGLEWHNGHPRISLDGKLEVFFEPRYCRYLKIIQTGSDPRFDWSIAEINLYQAYDKK